MNVQVTQSFEEFAQSLTTFDIALYAGAGLVLWILFKDQLSPVQKTITDLFDSVKKNAPSVIPSLPDAPVVVTKPKDNKDEFLNLVMSWKTTRDLAVENKCDKAVEMVDQIFPYLSPGVCNKQDKVIK